MPTIGVKRDELFERLGREYTDDEFQNLCFAFGLELDEVTSEKTMKSKEQGADRAANESEEVIYKIAVPANRYDLLCIEGLARALRIFMGHDTTPNFRTVVPAQGEPLVLTADPSVEHVRPHVVAAVLRDVQFTESSLASFIDLQERLHQNICRRRTLVAVGTHDLDTVKGPFTYTAQSPAQIVFKPLKFQHDKAYSAPEIMAEYKSDKHLAPYLPIIESSPLYPVIRDANGTVLSMPPIINSHHSRVTLDTRNIFIECTATDLTKAKIVLNIIVTAMGEYCAQKFTCEPVQVISGGKAFLYPDLSARQEEIDVDQMNKRIGIERTAEDFSRLLSKMQLPTVVAADGKLSVTVTAVRPDILHACDIWEDAAIGHGFNNIEWISPKVTTIAKQLPINKLTDQMRAEIAQAGYSEALTFALCSTDDAFSHLRRPNDGATAAIISNPKTQQFQIARPNLLTGLLQTISHNLDSRLPIKMFEISDVVLLDRASETGARNERRLAAAICNTTPDFEDVQGLLDHVMMVLGIEFVGEPDKFANPEDHPTGYYLRASNDPAFFGELGAADIIHNGRCIGVIGVVHPEVLQNYKIPCPIGALELNLEVFL